MNATFFYALFIVGKLYQQEWSPGGERSLWKRQEGAEMTESRSLQRITKRPRKAGLLFHPLQLKNRSGWDRATIWPQLRAMRCRSTKINGSNSTLDAHHYPDGVLGEWRRPPNREQRWRRQWSNAAAQLHDSRCLFLDQWQSWERTTAPLCNRALCRL